MSSATPVKNRRPRRVASIRDQELSHDCGPPKQRAGRVPLDAFIEVLLRINGLSASEARDRRNRFASNPALLMFLPSDFQAEVREFSVASGHGLLVFNRGDQNQRCGFCPGPGETLLVWSSPGRMYNLKGPLTPEQAIAFASSVK